MATPIVPGSGLHLTISDPWDLVTDLGDPYAPLIVVAIATLPDGRDAILARVLDDRLGPEARHLVIEGRYAGSLLDALDSELDVPCDAVAVPDDAPGRPPPWGANLWRGERLAVVGSVRLAPSGPGHS